VTKRLPSWLRCVNLGLRTKGDLLRSRSRGDFRAPPLSQGTPQDRALRDKIMGQCSGPAGLYAHVRMFCPVETAYGQIRNGLCIPVARKAVARTLGSAGPSQKEPGAGPGSSRGDGCHEHQPVCGSTLKLMLPFRNYPLSARLAHTDLPRREKYQIAAATTITSRMIHQ
jgi:hypothetical protein